MSRNPNNATWAAIVADQTFNLTSITGRVEPFRLSEFDYLLHDIGRALIVFGVNMGMCVMVAAVVLILSKPEKRRTPIFALNIVGLTLHLPHATGRNQLQWTHLHLRNSIARYSDIDNEQGVPPQLCVHHTHDILVYRHHHIHDSPSSRCLWR